MSESRLANIAVVLDQPQDPINIAATVRAMANMGASELRLVRPVAYEPHRLEGIAHGTRELIDRIKTFETFDEAVADCVRLAGFTARRRAAKRRIIDPRSAATELLDAAATGRVAMVFGREDKGLSNEVLDRVHSIVVIPTTEHSSMNLAQAVLIGLYELHLAAGDVTRAVAPPRKDAPPATESELEQFYADAEASLQSVEFFKTRFAEHIMRTVRSLTGRASPDARELSLMRAMAIEIRNYMERRRT